jgi:8-oxo-dGTP pyrophosphatase MutT (NUDIX family)
VAALRPEATGGAGQATPTEPARARTVATEAMPAWATPTAPARATRARATPARGGPAMSAGGLVIRTSGDGTEIVLGRRSRRREGIRWTLPKGTPDAGESVEQTAVREVEEETGLRVRIVEPVGSIRYSFVQSGTRIDKTVHHFLMVPTGGNLSDHDREFDEVRWVPVTEAVHLLSYETEREIVERATPAIAALRERGSA